MLNYRYHVKLSNSILLDGERQRYSIFFYQHLAAFVYPRSTLAKDRDCSKAVASSLSLNLMIPSAQILKIKEIKKRNVKRYIERCVLFSFWTLQKEVHRNRDIPWERRSIFLDTPSSRSNRSTFISVNGYRDQLVLLFICRHRSISYTWPKKRAT